MKNLIFKIHAQFQLKLFRAFLLVIFLTVCAFGQGTGDSVVIINTTPAKGPASAVAHWTEQKIGAGLLDKFPCVDFASTEDIAAILGLERMKELLGGDETSPEQWKSLADAIGARYVVVVKVTVMANGQTIVSAQLLDTKTTSTIANELETAANAEAAIDNAESVAKKLMQTFSNIFKNKCEPHWTGTVSFAYKQEKTGSKTVFERGGGNVKDITTNVTESTRTANIVEAVLQPMTQGFEGTKKTMARVVHRYEHRDEYIRKQTFSITCRAPGQNTQWRQTNAENSEITDESGEKTATMLVRVNVYQSSGKFEISVDYPALTTRWHTENKNAPAGGCQNPEPNIMILDGEVSPFSEGFIGAGTMEVSGEIDPQKPDTLSGENITGDLENGQTTIKWNLRFVKPNQKKKI